MGIAIRGRRHTGFEERPISSVEAGIGGQTAIFHAVTQFDDGGLPVTQLLIERGADLTVRVKVPGGYERAGEIVECTAFGYALLFGGDSQRRTVALLRERGAAE